MDFGETLVIQLSNSATSTTTKSNGDIVSLWLSQGSWWARATWAATSTKPQLTRESHWKCLHAVLEKIAIHYYVPAQTKECCRGYTTLLCQLTDLQPKNLLVNLLNSAARSEQERGFKVQLQRPSCTCAVYILFISCIYCFYTITICSFMKTNYCCYYCLQDILWEVTIRSDSYLLRGNYHI